MERLRKGFTTGSCAAAAAKAASQMCFENRTIEKVSIMTPGGLVFEPDIFGASICKERKTAECYCIKESGDDPDITSGIYIYAKVELIENDEIIITGGEGIGRVTRPGLDQPVGEYAINSVPRQMIKNQVESVLSAFDYEGGARVTIYAPEGVKLAEKTFNPHMGIEGGISIIGTTGIVEPMSTKALIDTIKLDIAMQYAENPDLCIMAPGNYGVTFLYDRYGIDPKRVVLFSNYFGESIKMAKEVGFEKVLLCSHIGKLIKVSGGIMNTHSMYGDKRMELMNDSYIGVCHSLGLTVDQNLSKMIMDSVSTTAVLEILPEELILPVSDYIATKALSHMNAYVENQMDIEVIMYDNKFGELTHLH